MMMYINHLFDCVNAAKGRFYNQTNAFFLNIASSTQNYLYWRCCYCLCAMSLQRRNLAVNICHIFYAVTNDVELRLVRNELERAKLTIILFYSIDFFCFYRIFLLTNRKFQNFVLWSKKVSILFYDVSR